MDILNVQPATIEWRIYRHDTTTLTVVLTDLDGNPLDLTDWEFESVVREYPKDEEAIQALSIVKNENTLTLGLDNTNLPEISFFDIQGTNETAGKVSTILRGQIFVEEDVTR